MAVEVLLMDNVADLGAEGDVVKVAEGYARNCLFPKRLAAPVTTGMRRRLARLQEQRQREGIARKQAADALADALTDKSYTIAVKVAENERLYGSVTPADIAEVVAREGQTVDKNWIHLPTPIRELGVYDVKIMVPPSSREVVVKIWVVEE